MAKQYILYRPALWALLGCLMLSTAGCVYWRLNQFRNQMSAFPDYYRIEQRDLPTVLALQPVLQPDDLGWLSGLPASSTESHEGRVVEIYHYVKQYRDPAMDENGAFDMIIPAHFNERGRLEAFQFPLRFASILTEENFDEVFRPMRDGHVGRGEHSTGWVWEEHRVNIPVRVDIEFFFGEPYAMVESDEGLVYVYAYRLKGNDTEWNPTGWDAYARFIFEPEEERVIYAKSYMGRLSVTVDLRAPQNVVEIRRL